MSDQYTRVIHRQVDGNNIVKLYDVQGRDTLTGTWPIEDDKTPLESAVEALWSGYFEVQDRKHLFGKHRVSVWSSVKGAMEQFVKEFEGEDAA
ncbi:hypothetical protein [Paenibacillus sp. 23TSA30-6]|uniref:hypothetical protein n=1 Tax=Paenibacillus sp. 23TSA30-6 TaxID=2546104 RepID=UPI0017878A2E|nr:hypothetical protein [Paenibacillus sp. 23TSA30-6]MBE0335576.1 hypothetical protein [Paenibacillus sp. 23TSA30-6]